MYYENLFVCLLLIACKLVFPEKRRERERELSLSCTRMHSLCTNHSPPPHARQSQSLFPVAPTLQPGEAKLLLLQS